MADQFTAYKSPYGYEEWDWQRWRADDVREAHADAARVGEDVRSPFARDHDRLVYTSAFRRLQGKTQVVTPGQADFFHTRLTHTIEVAQLARRLAEYLNFKTDCSLRDGTGDPRLSEWRGAQGWVDPDVCEAAAVLHDLGHPPFGHAGEVALAGAVDQAAKAWKISVPVGSFEGNAQSFRMATRSLAHKPGEAGLQLTRAVLDAGLKYPWQYEDPDAPKSKKKWGVYPTETEAFEWLRDDRVPTELRRAKTLEAQIMDWADDVAYSIHDLDDWYRAGFMPLAELARGGPELERLKRLIVERKQGTDGLSRAQQDHYNREIGALFSHSEAFRLFREGNGAGGDVGDPSSAAAREAVRALRSFMFDQFTTAIEIRVRDDAQPDWPRRYSLRLEKDPATALHNEILRDLLWIYVVGSHHMATHQAGQGKVVERLMTAHAAAAKDPSGEAVEIFPPETRELLRDASDPVARLRHVVDYVSAMTDPYAQRADARLTGATAPFNEYL